MTARLVLTVTVCALAAFAGACDNERSVRISSTSTSTDSEGKGVLKVVDALQCPQTLGSLTRKGTATDGGRTCTYTGPTIQLPPAGALTIYRAVQEGLTNAQKHAAARTVA